MATIDDVRRLSDLNMTFVDISVSLGINRLKLWKLCKEEGYTKPHARKLGPEERAEIHKMNESGYKKKAICARYGITYPTLKSILQEV